MSRYWKRNQLFIAGLLLIWAAVTFGVPYFAVYLHFKILGSPFGFWMAAQGALLVYLAIVAYYGWVMNRLDVQEQSESKVSGEVKVLNG